ncbi:hypothetical protein [Flaviflexus salsibiostraticola]|nr:hypothetical protein [Flaviflexus salsibiostraticola]
MTVLAAPQTSPSRHVPLREIFSVLAVIALLVGLNLAAHFTPLTPF